MSDRGRDRGRERERESESETEAETGNANAVGDSSAQDLEWLTLENGEEVVWADGPDRRTLVPAFLVGIPLSILLVGVFVILAGWLQVKNTDYVVTNRALYKKTGTFSRDVQRIDYDKVQNISYSQSALGNYFGYGSVDISTAGGSGVEMKFRSVRSPQQVQQRISERIKGTGPREDDTDRTKADVLDEILTELRGIREAVEGDGSRSSPADDLDADLRDHE